MGNSDSKKKIEVLLLITKTIIVVFSFFEFISFSEHIIITDANRFVTIARATNNYGIVFRLIQSSECCIFFLSYGERKCEKLLSADKFKFFSYILTKSFLKKKKKQSRRHLRIKT